MVENFRQMVVSVMFGHEWPRGGMTVKQGKIMNEIYGSKNTGLLLEGFDLKGQEAEKLKI